MSPKDPRIPWSDLKLVMTIGREGSLRAAAKALRISHPTVSRRVAELQADLGVHLFEREGRRLRLTAAGEDLAQTAARIEVEVDGLSRRIIGRDHRLEGLVRVALSPSMFSALTPALPDFWRRHPGIQLEFVTDLALASLTRREADIAIRFTDSPPETLVGRKLSKFEQAVYVHRSLQAQLIADGLNDPLEWPWVDWDEAHSHHSSARWVTANVEPERVVVRSDNSLTMFQLLASGAAVGFAPTMLAAPHPDLIRVEPRDALPTFPRTIWVLTHADLRDTGRVRATTQWLGELLFVENQGVWRGWSAPG